MRQPPVLTFVIDIWYQPLAPLLPVAYVGASITNAQNVETADGDVNTSVNICNKELKVTTGVNHASLTCNPNTHTNESQEKVRIQPCCFPYRQPWNTEDRCHPIERHVRVKWKVLYL